MSEKEKAPAGVAAPTEANERDISVSISQYDSTSFSGARQVCRFLLHGESNAISARELARLMGYRDTRPLRLAVERERRAGALILICERGYFLPSFDEPQREQEVRRYVRLMDSRVRSNRAAVQACRIYLRRHRRMEIEGQEVLFDEK